jgi:hypothetical protein
MATTTNYGWTTPDDTALVKDGAAAIRTLGSSVDTTTKNLNPSTTLGDIEYRSSTANVNTRLPLGTAGQVLKVNSGATAPEWSSDNAGMTNPMTTTGDTIYSSSGSTPARLAIGSTGNVLTVAGGVPTWAAPAGGGGKVLQVVQATYTTETTSTSQSYVATGLTANITPTLSTSKILVIVSQVLMVNRASTADVGTGHQLYRGATAIFGGDSTSSQYFYSSANGTVYYSTRIGASYLDSPATTSSTTYSTKMAANSTATTVSAQPNSNTSSIILMEIGA